MPTRRQLFLSTVANTSEMPLLLEVERASGMFIYTTDGKKYLDLNSGISVSSLGHCHPAVVEAVQEQVGKHMHTMVYGEHIHQPQVAYASLLTKQLPDNLSKVYFVMTGTEAVEVAIKLGRRKTGRYEIIAAKNAYHGSTYGAEALRSDLDFTASFAPGMPGVRHIQFNDFNDVNRITGETAAVIMEPVQAESGVNPPRNDYLQAVKKRCEEVGALLVFDEIQTGSGRTGSLFAFQKYNVVPDIMTIAKGIGGGMPIGAVVSSEEILKVLTKNPALGHITTFGGHPVSCAAAHATLSTLLESNLIENVERKANKLIKGIQHEIVKEIRNSGLMIGVELTHRKYLKHVIAHMLEQGALIDNFLFNDRSFRLAPPLIIDDETIDIAIEMLQNAFNFAKSKYSK